MADLGSATTVTFATSSWAPKILSVGGPGMTRPAVDTTHLGTTGGYRTYLPGDFWDPGEMSMSIQHEASDDPPTTGVSEGITIKFGGSTSNQTSGNGFLTGYNPTAEDEGVLTADITVQWTGVIAMTTST